MRRTLDRMALVVAAVCAGLCVLLATAVVAFVVASRRDVVTDWLATDPSTGVARFGAAMLAVGAVSGVTAYLVTLGRRARVERSSRELVELATRFAAGEARLAPVHSEIDEIEHVSGVMTRRAHDMTKSLAAERDFAADASHQLRTPLTALLMRLEEISETDDADVVKEEANIAIAQVERLTRVVDDLLGRTRGSGGPSPAVSLDSVIAALQRE